MNDLKNNIELIINRHFPESDFRLYRRDYTSFIISGNYLSKAINYYKNEGREVNVLKWFSDFWVFFEISLIENKDNFPKIFVNLSVFQGEEDDSHKNQLFRADWDNYDSTQIHPQPHWHFYPNKYDYKTTADFESFLTLSDETGFDSYLKKHNRNLIDLSKIHFTMSGTWFINGTNKSIIHNVDDEQILFDWFSGLLGHIREQLEYAASS